MQTEMGMQITFSGASSSDLDGNTTPRFNVTAAAAGSGLVNSITGPFDASFSGKHKDFCCCWDHSLGLVRPGSKDH